MRERKVLIEKIKKALEITRGMKYIKTFIPIHRASLAEILYYLENPDETS